MIYAIGDSFTEGAELPYCTETLKILGAWPELLSKKANCTVINKGKSASGNSRIVKRTIDAVLNKATGIIICWTAPERLEFIDNTGIYDVWPGRDPRLWLTTKQGTDYRLSLVKYLTVHQSEKHCYLHAYKNWLRQIILIQSLCKSHNVPCTMLIAFGAHENATEFHSLNEVHDLIAAIDLSIFVNNTLEESTVDWTFGTPKGVSGHPLEEGHQIIANKVYEHIRNLGWLS